MKTLEEYEKDVRERYRKEREDMYKTGIACPDCGEELLFINPYSQLCSSPPKKEVKCNCGFKTYIIV